MQVNIGSHWMFEEVPRRRSGFAGLSARRIVLGPFVVGSGVLLATVGGSVAVAATVFTASAIHVSDSAPRHVAAPVIAASTSRHPAPAVPHSAPATTTAPATTAPARVTSHGVTTAPPPIVVAVPPATSASRTVPGTAVAPATTSASAPSRSGSAGAPTPTHPDPVGNALIYLSDYDAGTKLLQFEYAERLPDGADGNPSYQVSSPRGFTAGLADTVVITSGGTVCGRAGNVCTPAELISAVRSAGLFASVGVGAGGVLQSVVELPDRTGAGQINPAPVPSASAPSTAPSGATSPSATPSATPSPSASPTA